GFENPIMPNHTSPMWNSCDGDHSGGVLPAESTIFAEKYGKWASGISSSRRYSSLTSKLWLPSPSALMPMSFIMVIVGLSPKKLEMGGVAPTESPAAMVNEAPGASWR